MQINDKVQRTDMFGRKEIFTIHDANWLAQHEAVHKNGGYEYAVLVDGEWVNVPREVVDQKPIVNVCISCES